MSDCLFCKIVAGAIPNYTVYEDDNVLAFLDIHPCSQGHTVVIPKKHFREIGEMDADSWQKLAAGLQASVNTVQKVLQPDAMNIGINDRPVAGQAVAHAHWHIIPRWEGDGGGSMHSIIRSREKIDVPRLAGLFQSF